MTARIYRLFDVDDAPLYVGVSANPVAQLHKHATSGKPWVTRMATAKFGEPKPHAEALAEMDDAVRAEKPLFNAAHVARESAVTPQVIVATE